MLLVDIEPFDPALFDGYMPMGHRGNGVDINGIDLVK